MSVGLRGVTISKMLDLTGLFQIFEDQRNQISKSAMWKSWTICAIFVKAPMQFAIMSAAGLLTIQMQFVDFKIV